MYAVCSMQVLINCIIGPNSESIKSNHKFKKSKNEDFIENWLQMEPAV